MAQEGHPLDDESIAVVVTLTHGPTLTQTICALTTEPGDGISVSDLIRDAGGVAMDDMILQLEQIGG